MTCTFCSQYFISPDDIVLVTGFPSLVPVAAVVFSLMQFRRASVSPRPAPPVPVRAGRPFPRAPTAPLLLNDTFLESFIRANPPSPPLHRRKRGRSPAQRHRCPHILTMPRPGPPGQERSRGPGKRPTPSAPTFGLVSSVYMAPGGGEPLGCPAPAGPRSTCHRAASPVLPRLCIVVPNPRSMC